MSHTSQRRGLDPNEPGREIVVLAMVPAAIKDESGAGEALSEVALKMLEHNPDNWISRNFTEITIPDIGPLQGPVEWAARHWPERTERLVMSLVGQLSSVVTAVYTDTEDVAALIDDLKGEWLERNKKKGVPVSIVLSGLFDDSRKICKQTGQTEHTYLHSLGFFGAVADLPSPAELEIITMCGHGLIAATRVRDLADKIKREKITVADAAAEVARPCVCGIVNRERAEEVFARLVESQ